MRYVVLVTLAGVVCPMAYSQIPTPTDDVSSCKRITNIKAQAACFEKVARKLSSEKANEPKSSPDYSKFIEWATQTLAANMLDPSSIKYRGRYVTGPRSESQQGETLTLCGEMNAKNAYGGYTGFRRFYVSQIRELSGGVRTETHKDGDGFYGANASRSGLSTKRLDGIADSIAWDIRCGQKNIKILHSVDSSPADPVFVIKHSPQRQEVLAVVDKHMNTCVEKNIDNQNAAEDIMACSKNVHACKEAADLPSYEKCITEKR